MGHPYSNRNMNTFANGMHDYRNKLGAYSGQQKHIVANSSSADVDIENDLGSEYLNCRYIKVDVTGIIAIDYRGDNGVLRHEVLVASVGADIKIPNVVKVYRYYVGTTSCTSQVYTDAGVAVVGIKLCF